VFFLLYVLVNTRLSYMKTTDARKRATQNYLDKKTKEGWKWMTIFVPSQIKEILMKQKHNLMKEYYEKTINK